MLKSRYFVLIPLLLFLIATLGLARGYEPIKWQMFLFLHLLLFALSLPSRLIASGYRRVGYLYFALTCISLFLLLVISWTGPFTVPFGIPPEAIAYPFLVSYGLVLVLFFIAVPIAIIPYFRSRLSGKLAPSNVFDTDFVTQGLENIKRDFQEVQNAVTRETIGIDHAIDALQKNLRSQADELNNAQDQLSRTKHKLQEYETLLSLTKQQRETLLVVMGRRKYVDYLVGFILGIVGSAMVQWFPKLLALFSK